MFKTLNKVPNEHLASPLQCRRRGRSLVLTPIIMDPIRAAVVGAGLAATVFHVPLVLSFPTLFNLVAVVERTPPADAPEGTIAKKFGVQPKLYNKLEDVLNDPHVELIVVATPNSTHFEFAKKALEAGKHGE